MVIMKISQLFTSAIALSTFAHAAVIMSNKWVAEQEIRLPGIESSELSGAPGTYKAAPLRWFGQAFANGPNITIVGRNFEHIFSKLEEINPDFQEFNKAQLLKQQGATKGLEKRQESHTICDNKAFKDGASQAFSDGVYYLRTLSSWCVVDGGKGSCNRCSCSWNSGIWMCNDSNRGITHQYMYCSDMGDRADTIMRTCNFPLGSTSALSNGQWFRHDTEYSVLMAGTQPEKC